MSTMRAFSERFSDSERGRGRKRPRGHPGPKEQEIATQPAAPIANIPGNTAAPAQDMTALPMSFEDKIAMALRASQPVAETNTPPVSFEAKIALALQGSSWQELQTAPSSTTPAVPQLVEQGGVPLQPEVAEAEPNAPPELSAKQRKKKERFDQNVARDAGTVLQTISPDQLVPGEQSVTWDQDPELICSYNWKASTDDTNTIFVPGAPAKWAPPTLPHALPNDTGFQYADYNYARGPRTPYEPMFRALGLMNPDYQFNDVDVLCDRNNLRVLLEFCQGRANGPFRLDLYSIFDTVVIVRNENRWWKHADGKGGVGGNFEKFFTRPAEGMEDATSHYRAIRYPMGSLNIVCRFEADAYDDGAVDALTESESQAVSGGGLTQRPTFKYSAPIRVLQKGQIIPTAQMVELKTKAWKEDVTTLVQCQDQLWFGRTKLLYTGPYEASTGLVRRIKYEDATARVKKWEDVNQEGLRKLVALLAMLKAAMKKEKRPNHAVVLVREDKAGPLTVRSREGMQHAVGRDAFQRHWRRDAMQGFGGQMGQRGGERGYHNAPRGRGYGDRGGFARGGYGGGGQYLGYAPPAYRNGGVNGGGRGGAAPVRGRGYGHERGGYGR